MYGEWCKIVSEHGYLDQIVAPPFMIVLILPVVVTDILAYIGFVEQ